MSHPDDPILNDLLDGRLPADEAEALRARLATDAELQRRYESLAGVGDWLRREDPAAAVEPSADFGARLRARIDPQGTDSAASRPSSPRASSSRPSSPRPSSGTPGQSVARTADGRPRILRFAGWAYAAAALVVVGLGANAFLMMNESNTPGAVARDTLGETELAKGDRDGEGAAGDGDARGRLEKGDWNGLDDADASPRIDSAPPDARDRVARGSGGSMGARGDGALPPPANATPESPSLEGPTLEGSLPMPAAGTPAGRPVIRGPGGAVPRDLRRPSDSLPSGSQPTDSASPRSRARRGDAPELQRLAASMPTYVVLAEDPAAARADLHLFLSAVRKSAASSRRVDGAPPLPRSFTLTRVENPQHLASLLQSRGRTSPGAVPPVVHDPSPTQPGANAPNRAPAGPTTPAPTLPTPPTPTGPAPARPASPDTGDDTPREQEGTEREAAEPTAPVEGRLDRRVADPLRRLEIELSQVERAWLDTLLRAHARAKPKAAPTRPGGGAPAGLEEAPANDAQGREADGAVVRFLILPRARGR